MIEFDYETDKQVDIHTAWQMAYVEAAARDLIDEHLEVVPDADAPAWLQEALAPRTAEVFEEVDIIKSDTSRDLIRIEHRSREIGRDNRSLDDFFFQPVIVRRTRWGDVVSERTMPLKQVLKDFRESDRDDERTKHAVREIYDQIAEASGVVRRDRPAEPQIVTLFDNSDRNDLEGGRRGSDVLRALLALHEGFDQVEVIKSFERNLKIDADGSKSTFAVFSPMVDGGSGAGYYFADYPDYRVKYRIEFTSHPDGIKNVRLLIASCLTETTVLK